MLRRVRLLKACQFICSENNFPADTILKVTKAKLMRKLSGMPAWWCPWIHDVALLFQAATGGLFSVLCDRENHHIFSSEAVRQNLYSSYLSDESSVPAAKRTPPEQVSAWAERQATKFPSINQLERRLATLCCEATAEADSQFRFFDLPMFDHGGWPRN
jgi:hypothetical protein